MGQMQDFSQKRKHQSQLYFHCNQTRMLGRTAWSPSVQIHVLIASMSWEMEFPDVASKQFLVKWQILSWLCNMMKNILTQKNFLSDSFQTFYVFSWRKENNMSHSNTKVTDKRSIESSFTYEYIFMYSISLILIAPAVCINDTHFRILWLKKLFVKKVWKKSSIIPP